MPAETFFPASAIADKTAAGPVSHCDKLAFRGLLPVLSYLTGGGFWTMVVANHAAALLLFGLIYRICMRTTARVTLAVAVTWAYAACWSGAWGFNDMVYGDAVALALTLAAVLAGHRFWLVAPLILAAGLADERAICAAPLVMLFRYWEARPPFGYHDRPLPMLAMRRIVLPVLLGVLGYMLFRLLASHLWDLKTGTSMVATSRMLAYHFYINYPGTLFKVFEFMWAWPLLMVFALAASGRSGLKNLAAYLTASGTVAGIALIVWDFDRSLYYLWPSVLAGICFGPGSVHMRTQLALGILFFSLWWIMPTESVLGRLLLP